MKTPKAPLIPPIFGPDAGILDPLPMEEMTRIKKGRFRLPFDIWVSPRMGKHGPRVKVATKPSSRFGRDDSFTLTISDNPQVEAGDPSPLDPSDLRKIITWVAANRDALNRHWIDDTYDDLDLMADLKPF